MKLYAIEAGSFKLDGGAMFGVVPKVIWNKLNPADENNLCTWAMRSLLIDTGDKRILIDTGIGNKQDSKFLGHYHIQGPTLEQSLAAHGYTSDDVTDVFHTHLHFDHCGGSVARQGEQLVPVFKNADYWSNEKHWNWAINPNQREKASFLKENLLPLQDSGRLKFAPLNGSSFFLHEDISLKFAYGHTEAMMLPVIRYNGRTIVYMADLLPSAAHLPLPYIMSYDMFPMKTLTEKKQFLDEALSNDYVLFLEHDPLVECCTLQMNEKGIRVRDTFKLAEL